MQSKADFIKRLHESESFKRAMSQTRTNGERKRVAAAAEEFISTIAEVVGPLLERLRDDPEFREQLARSLAERQGLVTGTDPVLSGSSE